MGAAINIGFGATVMENRVISVLDTDSAPVKRMIQNAKDNSMLVDATYGRKARSVIVCDSQHIVLTAVQAETIANRINGLKSDSSSDDE